MLKKDLTVKVTIDLGLAPWADPRHQAQVADYMSETLAQIHSYMATQPLQSAARQAYRRMLRFGEERIRDGVDISMSHLQRTASAVIYEYVLKRYEVSLDPGWEEDE